MKKQENYNFYMRYGFLYNLFSKSSKFHRSKIFLIILIIQVL